MIVGFGKLGYGDKLLIFMFRADIVFNLEIEVACFK